MREQVGSEGQADESEIFSFFRHPVETNTCTPIGRRKQRILISLDIAFFFFTLGYDIFKIEDKTRKLCPRQAMVNMSQT